MSEYPEQTDGGLWRGNTGTECGTPDGLPPSHGTDVVVYDGNGNTQPGQWINGTAVPYSND